MERVALFANREQRKASFLQTLYVLRVHLLGISPTSRRHIAGAPLEQNFEALEDIVALAKRHGTQVLVYNAPVNPAVDMFFPEEYAAYVQRLRALCAGEGIPFADLATAVPENLWGYWIDGPDPIHFNAEGHRVIHARLEAELLPDLAERP
jgi:lysophospholipase L1-like esterase